MHCLEIILKLKGGCRQFVFFAKISIAFFTTFFCKIAKLPPGLVTHPKEKSTEEKSD